METVKYINIVYTIDRNYIKPVIVSMTSVLENLTSNYFAKFYIFAQGFEKKDLKFFEKLKTIYNCEIVIIPMEPYLEIFNFIQTANFQNKWISIACYFRLLIFKILPLDVGQVFYIDSDIIINCDLSKIRLEKNKIMACCIEPWAMQHREIILKHCYIIEEFAKFKNAPLQYPYFNAGFFLVDLNMSRKLNIYNKIINLLYKYSSLPYCDQDLLNIIFGQDYSELLLFLPPEYNVFTDINYNIDFNNLPYEDSLVKIAVNAPKIIHYAGPRKPWTTYEVPYLKKFFWRYAELSCLQRYYKFKKLILKLIFLQNRINKKIVKFINENKF